MSLRLKKMVIAGIGVGVLSWSIATAAPQNWQHWPARMQGLGAALTQLMLDASSEARFSSSDRSQAIAGNIKIIADHAHQLQQMPRGARPDADPSIPLIMQLLEDEMLNAHDKFTSGNYQYARDTVRAATSYCISCHTRDQTGPVVIGAKQMRDAKALSLGEQAEFYAAVRQYDRAIALFGKVVADHALAKQSPMEWRRALLFGLALSVRAQNSPDGALKFVDGALHNPWIDDDLRASIKIWDKALREWVAAPSQPVGDTTARTTQLADLMRAARRTTHHAGDLSGAVYYLRATAMSHAMLRGAAPGVATAELLATLGECYDRVQDMQLWSLHNLYYAACVQAAPHTKIARQCAGQYKEAVEASFTGSNGVDLPPSDQARITALQKLAK